MRPRKPTIQADSPDVVRLIEARHHDPFVLLGRHRVDGQDVVRVYLPGARQVWIEDWSRSLHRIGETELFERSDKPGIVPKHYRLLWTDDEGNLYQSHDAYSFAPQLSGSDLDAFNQGRHRYAHRFLGANPAVVEGIAGTLFAVWAPNAERVSVVGDFNLWDGRRHPMRIRGTSGVWELFIPELQESRYKFELRDCDTGELLLKSDPYARQFELRPATAGFLKPVTQFVWKDHQWLTGRNRENWRCKPMAIYEVHLGSWQRDGDGGFLNYRELARQLCTHVRQLGFTHIELLPVSEHPLDDSWGYQATGYFAPTSRFGSADDFRFFVDYCHAQDIGVILDWVPAHFPKDAHALASFDGTALYEYHDPWKAEQRDWGTLVFNYERKEVKSFLISSAIYWLQEFHLDGLRVDAVASMLYLNFSRQAEHWVPNIYGGHHNLEAIDFIRELNDAVASECPGCLMIAEESSDWDGVTKPADSGGLGFHMKWNMGWMHDTLKYMAEDPIYRKYHHQSLTFGPTYAFNENFVLPFSHDEVVHLKRSMFSKMPGDDWQQFANLRLLYTYQWTFPGKPLLYMGGDFAQTTEWDHRQALPWVRASEPRPAGVLALIEDLNRLCGTMPALSQHDFEQQGFEWIHCDDAEHSILSYMRHGGGQTAIIVLNFTPVPREGYRLGVPSAGTYRQRLNSDAERYGGSNVVNTNHIVAKAEPSMEQPCTLEITLPPLAGVIFEPLPSG